MSCPQPEAHLASSVAYWTNNQKTTNNTNRNTINSNPTRTHNKMPQDNHKW